MKSRIYQILGIAFFVLGINLLILMFFTLMPGVIGMSLGGSSEEESYCVAEVTGVEPLGAYYEDLEADPGYSFYEITFSIENRSNVATYNDGPSFWFEGLAYGDVNLYDSYQYSEQEKHLFEYECEPYIPGRRRGEKKEVVQVRQGVTAIKATYRPHYDSEEKLLEVVLE